MFKAISSLIILLVGVAIVHGLSVDETTVFSSSGDVEQNTGLIGWVEVEDEDESYWRISSNGIPDHDTGDFPGRGNPNEILEQSFSFLVAKEPVVNDVSTCLPMGPIAIAVNGVVMFNPWDADGENAVEGEGAEVFDGCDGHPDSKGRYHYHQQPSSCLLEIVAGVPSPIIGVAFDGFPIYGPVDELGRTLTSSDLDECHGRVNTETGEYRYHTTSDFPYILGCYSGTPQNVNTGSTRCYKASETDEQGNKLTTTTPQTTDTPTTTIAPETTTKRCRRPNSPRCNNNRRRRRITG